MEQDIVAQGVELILYGMGTVVLFLTLLVVATAAMSRLMMQYFPDPQPPAAPVRPGPGEQTAGAVDRKTVAAITAAIHRHRGRQ